MTRPIASWIVFKESYVTVGTSLKFVIRNLSQSFSFLAILVPFGLLLPLWCVSTLTKLLLYGFFRKEGNFVYR